MSKEKQMIVPFYMPVKILFAPGSIEQVGTEAKALGRKALIISYPDIRKLGILDKVLGSLKKEGVNAEVFEELEPNPRTTTIDKAAAIARKMKTDMVIGLGGGSAMDAAKGVALASSGEASIWEYMLNKVKAAGRIPALIQIPTLAGTGSELNQIAVVTDWDSHEKRFIMEPNLWARTAIIDPALTVSVPRKLTAGGGLDAFAHIAECYLTSDRAFPINDAIREGVMKVTVQCLPKVLANPEDIESRTQICWASTIASSNFSRLGGSAGNMTCHGIEHAVSGYYDINHGAGLAALLPAWMKQIYPARKSRFLSLGRNVFGKEDGIAAFEAWLAEIGLNPGLKELGCEVEKAEKIAEIALKVWDFELHPTKIDTGVIAGIYRDAF